jgi:hemolysin activation/secretion protein
MRFKLLLMFGITGALQAGYDFEYYKPREMEAYPLVKSALPIAADQTKKEVIQEKKVLIGEVKAVIIAPDGEIPPDYIRATSRGTEFYRLSLDGNKKNQEELRKRINKLAVGKPLTFEALEKIKKDIINYYKDNGQALVVVSVQEQDITDGVIVFSVLESRLGEVTLTGNKWFGPERYTDFISIQPDDVIVDAKVEEDIAWANRSPYRKVDAIYKPGKTYGTTDIELNIQDQCPFRFFAGADNTGFQVTETARLFVGFNWGNVLDLDQMLAFQYITSPNFSSFQGVMLNYTVPLPWRDLLVFYGGYSKVQVNDNFLPFNVQEGQSWQFSSRYVYPFSKGTFRQQADVGFDYKATNNDLIVGEDVISTQIATVLQLAGTYQVGFTYGQHGFDGNGEAYVQPWSIGQSMSRENYDLLRPNASPYYIYFKLGGEYRWLHESGTMIKVRARTQFSSAPLIPIEQMGFGGENSIRGYPERVVNADQGLILNFDLFSPAGKVFQSVTKNKSIQDGFRGTFFFDMGFAGLQDPLPGQPSQYFLAGMGPGFRYDLGPWLYVRFDYGFRLTDVIFGSASSSIGQPYFSVIGAY